MGLEGDTGIGCGGYGSELGLDGFTDIERVDELGDGRGGDALVGTGKGLQGLIGVGIALAAKDGLDALGDDSPSIVQVTTNGSLVEEQ